MKAKRNLSCFALLCEAVLIIGFTARFFEGSAFISYWLVLSFFLVPLVWIAQFLILDRIQYCIKGYAVYNPSEPDPPLVYKERDHEKIQFRMIRREHEDGVYYWVYVPEGEKWEATMPEWAKARRAEILARMIAEMKHDKSIHFEDKP